MDDNGHVRNTMLRRARQLTTAPAATAAAAAAKTTTRAKATAAPALPPRVQAVRAVTAQCLECVWTNAAMPSVHHALWLQDHDPKHVDPDSGQKLRSSAHVHPDKQLLDATVEPDGAAVRVTWNDLEQTVYPAAWLYEYGTTAGRARRPWIFGAAARPMLWTERDVRRAGGPSVDANTVLKDDRALWQLLQHLHDYGLVFVRNVPTDNVDASARIAERIGPIHETFYGRLWDVRSMPHAYNIAYTSGNLGLHQDLECVTRWRRRRRRVA